MITHEIGHSLGLEHNHSGSSHASIDNLRDKAMIEHYGHWVGHVTAHLGGCRYVDGKQLLESAEYCRKAVRFLQDYVFTPPTWLFDRQIIDAVHADRQESIDKLYKSCMDSMRYALELMAKQPADQGFQSLQRPDCRTNVLRCSCIGQGKSHCRHNRIGGVRHGMVRLLAV